MAPVRGPFSYFGLENPAYTARLILFEMYESASPLG
jgi:hypothetical protein